MPIFRRVIVNTILPPLPPWNNFYTGAAGGVVDQDRLFHLEDFLALINTVSTASPAAGNANPTGPGPNTANPRGNLVNAKALEIQASISQYLRVLPNNPIENAIASSVFTYNLPVGPGIYNLTIDGGPAIPIDPARPGLPLENNYDFRMHLLHTCYLFSKFLFASQLMRLNGKIWNRANWLFLGGEGSYTNVGYGGTSVQGDGNYTGSSASGATIKAYYLYARDFSPNQAEIYQTILSLYQQLSISVPPSNITRYGPPPLAPGLTSDQYSQVATDNPERVEFNAIFTPYLKPGRDFSDNGSTIYLIRENGARRRLSRINTGRVYTGFIQMVNDLASRETFNLANEIINSLNSGQFGNPLITATPGRFGNIQTFTNTSRFFTLSVGKGNSITSILNLRHSPAYLFSGYQFWAPPDSLDYPKERRAPRTWRLVSSAQIRTRANKIFFRNYGFNTTVINPNITPGSPPAGVSYILVIINNFILGFWTFAWDVSINGVGTNNSAPMIMPTGAARVAASAPILSAIPKRIKAATLPTNTVPSVAAIPNEVDITSLTGTLIASYNTLNGFLRLPPNAGATRNIQIFFGNNINSTSDLNNEERHLMVGLYI